MLKRLWNWLTSDQIPQTIPTVEVTGWKTIIRTLDKNKVDALVAERVMQTGTPHVAEKVSPGVWEVRMVK
jgi:hypothetical protein